MAELKTEIIEVEQAVKYLEPKETELEKSTVFLKIGYFCLKKTPTSYGLAMAWV